EYDILSTFNVAASARYGGTIRMRTGDTLISTGRIPNRYAASIGFTGLPQTLIAVRAAREEWSSMQPLRTDGSQARDATDISVGLETAGPRAGDRAIVMRLGGRRRTLPFDVGTTEVRETSFGGGLGIPVGLPRFGSDRATIDLSLLHSS